MARTTARRRPPARLLCALAAALALVAPATASAAPSGRPAASGKLIQLPGTSGCVVDRSQDSRRCAAARALRGPAPFLGSNAVAMSPDGRNVYVAASSSKAIVVFRRDRRSGELSQRRGAAGCVSASGAAGCATAVGLRHPNSVAVSPDGANVYATALGSNAVTAFSRARNGALRQLGGGGGCIADAATAGCTTGRALGGADVVAVSPDGANVYVGAFFDNAVAVLARDPATGALSQPAGEGGCIADAAVDGCASGIELGAPEGLAVSGDANNVYVAAALSNAVDLLDRDPSTGALTQAGDGSGCITDAATPGCTTGLWLEGANAVAVSPDDADVYVTSLLSNSLTAFTRSADSGELTQQAGTSACAIYVLAVGCSLARAMKAPEGVTVSPDATSVYAAGFDSNAIAVFARDTGSGALIQKSRRAGCVVAGKVPDCARGRALLEVSSTAVSPDGRHLYAAAFESDAVTVFKRVKR